MDAAYRIPLLAGRTALVTGASRGIGAATAAALDRAGARVALSGRTRGDLASVADALMRDPLVLPADLSVPDEVERLASTAVRELGGVDILVNNAGAAARMPTEDLDAPLIDELYAVNVRAPLLLISRLIPSLRERGHGSIINLSSISAIVGTPNRAAYAATKGALDAATRSLAIELGPIGVRVNSVAPGVVDTALWARNREVPGVVEQVVAQTPLRRWSTPDDVADVIVFLASDMSRFVTGETLSVAGGMGRTFDLYAGAV